MSDIYGTQQGLAEIETELGQTFSWAGGVYPCIIGGRNETKALELDGFALGADLTLVVRAAALPIPPGTQHLVTVGDRTLRVETVTHSPDGLFYVVGLIDPSRGV